MRTELYVLLVCGGRFYGDGKFLYSVLDTYRFLMGKMMIVTGAAKGADLLAESWAKSRQQVYVGMPAEWDEYGKAAGMKRNREMPALILPSAIAAFPGGVGTSGMISVADRLGIHVHKWGDWS